MDGNVQSNSRPLRASNDLASEGCITLLFGNADLTRLALYGVTRVAADQHSVWVLDGANSFDAYFVARLARSWNYAPETILAHIKLSRVFTCYQMNELITRRLVSAVGSTKRAVILCLGLLDTFYDDDVPLTDAVRMIRMILTTFTVLVQRGYTILITVREPRNEQKERSVLLNLIRASAQRVECFRASPNTRKAFMQQPLLLVEKGNIQKYGAYVTVVYAGDFERASIARKVSPRAAP